MKYFGKKGFLILLMLFLGLFIGNIIYEPKANIISKMRIITVQNHDHKIITRATGYEWKKEQIITTGHLNVHPNNAIFIENTPYSISYIDQKNDIMILTQHPNGYKIPNFQTAKNGEKIHSYVFRENIWKKIEGTVIGSDKITGYNNNGNMYQTRGIIHNLDVEKGDSGSPIWNENNEIIDIIHIKP